MRFCQPGDISVNCDSIIMLISATDTIGAENHRCHLYVFIPLNKLTMIIW